MYCLPGSMSASPLWGRLPGHGFAVNFRTRRGQIAYGISVVVILFSLPNEAISRTFRTMPFMLVPGMTISPFYIEEPAALAVSAAVPDKDRRMRRQLAGDSAVDASANGMS
jgi:hypothetical protein